jgi:hypothetical protein
MRLLRSVGRDATRPRPHGTLTVALVAGALASLLACGSDGDGGPAPTPTPVTSPTPQPTPTVADTFPIAGDLPASSAVAAAWGDDRYLVTFSVPGAAGGSDVAGVRLDASGALLDAAPLVLSDFGDLPFLSPGAAYAPGGIAFGASSFGAFFFGSGTVPSAAPGQVVGFVGVPVAGPPALPATAIDEQLTFSMARTSLSPPVAAAGNGTLFVGAYQRILSLVGSFSVSRVTGQIVTRPPVAAQEIGPFSGAVPPVGGFFTSGSAPGVAMRDDSAALLAWVETAAPEGMPSDATTRLQGAVLADGAATPVTLAATNDGAQGVAVASDGTSFLVAWAAPGQATQPAALGELRAVRYAPGGEPQPSDGFVVATGSTAKDLVGVVFAGGSYLVAWIEGTALRGAVLGATGVAVETIDIDPGPVASAALATDGTRVLVVLDRPGAGGSSSVLGRFVTVE